MSRKKGRETPTCGHPAGGTAGWTFLEWGPNDTGRECRRDGLTESRNGPELDALIRRLVALPAAQARPQTYAQGPAAASARRRIRLLLGIVAIGVNDGPCHRRQDRRP
jgi:hypothetical protein